MGWGLSGKAKAAGDLKRSGSRRSALLRRLTGADWVPRLSVMCLVIVIVLLPPYTLCPMSYHIFGVLSVPRFVSLTGLPYRCRRTHAPASCCCSCFCLSLPHLWTSTRSMMVTSLSCTLRPSSSYVQLVRTFAAPAAAHLADAMRDAHAQACLGNPCLDEKAPSSLIALYRRPAWRMRIYLIHLKSYCSCTSSYPSMISMPNRRMQVREAAAVSISRLGVTEKIAHNEMSSDE